MIDRHYRKGRENGKKEISLEFLQCFAYGDAKPYHLWCEGRRRQPNFKLLGQYYSVSSFL